MFTFNDFSELYAYVSGLKDKIAKEMAFYRELDSDFEGMKKFENAVFNAKVMLDKMKDFFEYVVDLTHFSVDVSFYISDASINISGEIGVTAPSDMTMEEVIEAFEEHMSEVADEATVEGEDGYLYLDATVIG